MNRLIAEINSGTWMLSGTDPAQYKKMVDTILSGGKINEVKPEAYSVIGKKSIDSKGETKTENAVAVIEMVGAMSKYSAMCAYGAEDFAYELIKAQNNPDILGIILKMDGPGGNADAIPLFQSIKAQITKPVIALVDKADSLHYWIAALMSSHIMMNNDFTAEVGSIGVMVMFEKTSNEIVIVRPAESFDKNQALVDALNGDLALLEEKLAPLARRFQSEVKENRPQVKEEALHGKTYYASEAIEVGLADSVGDINKAYQMILALHAKKELNKIK